MSRPVGTELIFLVLDGLRFQLSVTDRAVVGSTLGMGMSRSLTNSTTVISFGSQCGCERSRDRTIFATLVGVLVTQNLEVISYRSEDACKHW